MSRLFSHARSAHGLVRRFGRCGGSGLLAAAIFASGAASATAAPPVPAAGGARGDVSGRVVDSTGAPVARLLVTASNGAASAVTDADGRFELVGAAGATLTFTRAGVAIAAIPHAGGAVTVTVPEALRTIGRAAVATSSTTAAGQVTTTDDTSLLGTRSIYATPYSVGGYTDALIEKAQARSLSDNVTNDSSIRVAANAYGDTELLSIRGFDYLPGATLFDGLPGLVNVTRPPLDGIERVDIIKGPSALLDNDSGLSAVGGSMNFIPKRAGDRPNASLELYGLPLNDEGAHLDVGRRFGPANEFGIRANIDGRSGATPVRGQHDDFGDQTLGVDYRRGDTVAGIDYVHEQHTILGLLPSIAVPEGIAIPAAPDDSIDLFDRSTLFTTSSTTVSVRLQRRISPNVSIDAAYGHRILQSDYEGADFVTLADSSGDAVAAAYPYYVRQNDDAARVGVRVRAVTGPVHHEFAFDVADAAHPNKSTFAFDTASAATNIYDPVPLAPLLPPVAPDQTAALTANSREHSAALADVVTAGRLTLIGGVRHQFIDQQSFDPATGDLLSESPAASFTPSVAGLYAIGPHLSVYANYIEQLADGNIAPGTAKNAGEQFPAFAARQTETGVKADLGRYGATLAAFSIFEPIAITDPTTDLFSQSGLQRNEGVELSLFGDLAPHVHAIAGLTSMQGIQVATAGGATNGKSAVGVPNLASSLNVDVDLPGVPGLDVDGRVVTTSRQTVDVEDTQSIPSWATFELGASYAARQRDSVVTTRFAVENLTNLHYWESARESALAPGVPRTFRLSVSIAGR